MEKRGKGEGGGWDSLPEELQIQILYFLPISTLLLLRAVAKWFRSTVDRPSFAVTYSHTFPENVSRDDPFILTWMPSPIPGNTHYRWQYRQILQSSVHGLCLMVDDKFGNVAYYAYIANFSTKRRRSLPRCISFMANEYRQFFLGYDETGKGDFRVLAKSSRRVCVFSFKARAWGREISARSGFRRPNKCLSLVICSRSLCFENALVWTESDRDEPDSLGLVWFGLADEKFRYSEKVPCVGRRSSGLMLLDGQASLGVWTVNDDVGHIWALQTDTMTWVRRYEVPWELMPFGDGIMVANVVERGGKIESWFWNDGEKSVENVSYDVRACAISRRGKEMHAKTCSCAPEEQDGDPTNLICLHGEAVCLGGPCIHSLVKF